MKKLILISGPSCVGKGPLLASLKKFHSNINYGEIPIIKSYESRNNIPRKNELEIWNNPDYFRYAYEINTILRKDDNFVVGDCRGFPQAIDLNKVVNACENILLLEVYHTIGAEFKKLKSSFLKNIQISTIFVSPLSLSEKDMLIKCGVNFPTYLKNHMIHKQIIRCQFLNSELDLKTISDIEKRAEDSIEEMKSIENYTDVIVNHDGEGSMNWCMNNDNSFKCEPEGDAGRALKSLVKIILRK